MSQAPLRGKRGQERRLGERLEVDRLRKAGGAPGAEAVDFDVAEVDREVEDERRREGAAQAAASAPAAPIAPAKPPRAARRLPDLAALPQLLHGSGTFTSLRERLRTSPGGAPKSGRHASLAAVPHGAKTYLAAALALGPDAERLVWVARDAEIGDRVADELAAWLGDPLAVATLEARTALAYERSELVADETAARVAALARWRSGRARVLVASVQGLVQHTIAPDDLPDRPVIIGAGERLGLEDLLRRLQDLGYSPVMEVAGRGEFARRGGIVDVFPPSEELPVRIEFFGDEIDSLRRFDPTDQRGVGPVERIELLPASEFLAPRDGIEGLRGRIPGLRSLPERLVADLARFEAASPAAGDPTNSSDRAARDGTAGGRALATGDAAEIWASYLEPGHRLRSHRAGNAARPR